DDGPRVGLRTALSLTSTAQRRLATLARPLQPAQTTQLASEPATDQPRSQRLWVGHLATSPPSVELRVQLGAEEDRPGRVVQPEQEHDRAGDRAVRPAVRAREAGVEREQAREHEPHQ